MVVFPNQSGKVSPKGHGRLGSHVYEGAEEIRITHPSLKPGDPCPEECGGRLYDISPGVFVRIGGQDFAKATPYIVQKLRCGLCGLIIKAELPAGMSSGKYDFRFKSILSVQKYFAGVPFYRQEQFQSLLHFPLSDATQWDLIEQVADSVYPVFGELERLAAQGEVIHNDDTPVRIMEVIKANRQDPGRSRKGMFTSGIYARVGSHQITLYYSGVKHAGENLSLILRKRSLDLAPIIHMCDALSFNLKPAFESLLGHCLAHGRRKFKEIDVFFPEECHYVIDQLGKIYGYEAESREKSLSAQERLIYHQQHSAPVMADLKEWLVRQFDEGLVEENGGLGKAISYLLKHWQALTLFLRVAGAPLDNNVVERSLKVAIRVRKNSLIHRTCHGARVGSILMSLIETCRSCSVNPVDYLTALQENKSSVFKDPSRWIPWIYEETLSQMIQEKAA